MDTNWYDISILFYYFYSNCCQFVRTDLFSNYIFRKAHIHLIFCWWLWCKATLAVSSLVMAEPQRTPVFWKHHWSEWLGDICHCYALAWLPLSEVMENSCEPVLGNRGHQGTLKALYKYDRYQTKVIEAARVNRREMVNKIESVVHYWVLLTKEGYHSQLYRVKPKNWMNEENAQHVAVALLQLQKSDMWWAPLSLATYMFIQWFQSWAPSGYWGSCSQPSLCLCVTPSCCFFITINSPFHLWNNFVVPCKIRATEFSKGIPQVHPTWEHRLQQLDQVSLDSTRSRHLLD